MHKKLDAIENCISFEHLIRSERENIKLNKLRLGLSYFVKVPLSSCGPILCFLRGIGSGMPIFYIPTRLTSLKET